MKGKFIIEYYNFFYIKLRNHTIFYKLLSFSLKFFCLDLLYLYMIV